MRNKQKINDNVEITGEYMDGFSTLLFGIPLDRKLIRDIISTSFIYKQGKKLLYKNILRIIKIFEKEFMIKQYDLL